MYIQIFCLFLLVLLNPGFSNISAQDSLSSSELYQIILEARENEDFKRLGDAYHALADRDVYSIEESNRAIGNYLNSIHAYEDAGDSLNYYLARLDLGRLYADQEYYDEALDHFKSGLSFFQRQEGSSITRRLVHQITDLYLAANQIAEGIAFLDQTTAIDSSTRDSLLLIMRNMRDPSLQGIDIPARNLTDTMINQLALRDAQNNTNFKSAILLNAGIYNMRIGKIPLAKYYLRRSADAARSNPGQLNQIYDQLARCYTLTGDTIRAFQYLQLHAQINDSLHRIKQNTILNDLIAQRMNQEQQSRIRQLKNDQYISTLSSRFQRIMNFSMLFGFIIVLLGAYFVIRFYQQKMNSNQIINKQREEIQERRIKDLENDLKIESMHSMLKGQEAERERVAKDLHDSLGGLLSTIKLHFDALQSDDPQVTDRPQYQKAYALLDTACNEVRNISNNMQPGALLKLGIVPAINDLINRAKAAGMPNIEFQHYGINGKLDSTLSLNIYRIVQELLNNTLKHAEASEVLVQLIRKDDEIMVMVEDDGIGYEHNHVKKGMGTSNIASRVNYLKGDISIHSVKGTGTTTLINIPAT